MVDTERITLVRFERIPIDAAELTASSQNAVRGSLVRSLRREVDSTSVWFIPKNWVPDDQPEVTAYR